MSVDADLVRLLKRLKLGQLVPTLPERLALARAQQLDYAQFLTLLLADEVQRREQQALERHLLQAGFEERITLDDFDWSAPIQLDRRQLQHVFTLQFLERKEHVLVVGPGPVWRHTTSPCQLASANSPISSRLSSMRSPLRLPDLTCTDLSLPEWTQCRMVCLDLPSVFAAAVSPSQPAGASGAMRAMTSSVTWMRHGA